MTADDRTVQVPVSLLQDVLLALRENTPQSTRVARGMALHALISQPTPTAEPDAWEQAAQIAERDSVGVTLSDLAQFPTVQATGARIAFNIRAAAQKNGPATAEGLRPQGPHPKVAVLGRNTDSLPDVSPRIEDLAPGTAFTEASNGWPRTAWTVGQRHDGTKYVKRQSDGWVLDPEYLDPSTIRDVTPPKETP